MKSTILIAAFALALSLGNVLADDNVKAVKNEAQVAKKKAAQPNHVEKQVLLTGSYIKRDIRRAGYVTDGPNAVYVLDRQSIESSGAADLGQVLIRKGFHR
jgi:hypothetical protein